MRLGQLAFAAGLDLVARKCEKTEIGWDKGLPATGRPHALHLSRALASTLGVNFSTRILH